MSEAGGGIATLGLSGCCTAAAERFGTAPAGRAGVTHKHFLIESDCFRRASASERIPTTFIIRTGIHPWVLKSAHFAQRNHPKTSAAVKHQGFASSNNSTRFPSNQTRALNFIISFNTARATKSNLPYRASIKHWTTWGLGQPAPLVASSRRYFQKARIPMKFRLVLQNQENQSLITELC